MYAGLPTISTISTKTAKEKIKKSSRAVGIVDGNKFFLGREK